MSRASKASETAMQRILIIGATSAIAERSARIWAARGAELFLAARNEARLAAVARDLEVRGAGRVVVRPFEAGDTAARHAELIAAAWESLGRVDAILIAHGDLPDQAACEADPARALAALENQRLLGDRAHDLGRTALGGPRQRHARGHLFARGRPGTGGELCLRRGQGGGSRPSLRGWGRGSRARALPS